MYAVVTSLWACAATASAAWIAPGGTTIPGGKPEIAVPGLTPRLPPVTVVAPVFVTAAPPSTRKLCAVPSTVGGTAALTARGGAASSPVMSSAIRVSSAWDTKRGRAGVRERKGGDGIGHPTFIGNDPDRRELVTSW